MKILLFGKDGQVGNELERALAPLGQLAVAGRRDVDLESADALLAYIRLVRPNVIVNAAAYTAVDQAELEPDRSFAVNAHAVEIMSREMAKNSGWMVHFSTDYVFGPGTDDRQSETSPVAPQSVYGRSKLAGEMAIIESGSRHLIFRTSWVYSLFGENFAKSILKHGKSRESLSVVDDQFGAPTSATLVADVTALVLHRVLTASTATNRLSGTYHLCASGETSWFGYAKFLVQMAHDFGLDIRMRTESIVPVPTAAYSTRASRPNNSRLDTRKLCETFGLEMPAWQFGVRRLVSQLGILERI